MWQFGKRVIRGSAFFYPLVMHVLIMHGLITAALIGLASVSLLACIFFLRERRDWLQALAFGAIATTTLLGLGNGQAFALYLPPVVINLVFALIFGRTLRADTVPLIERFMRAHHGDDTPPHLIRYARRLTWLWTAFFLAMAMVGVLLAAFAPLEVWSLFANVVNYLLVVVLFLGQFIYGYVRYRTPRLSDIIPMAIRMARSSAGHSSIGR